MWAGVYRWYCTNALNEYLTLDDSMGCPPSAPVDETFAYDEDGNMTQDKTFDYTWDGENRLVAAVPRSPVTGSKKVEFVYDYLGRRVARQAYTYGPGGWAAAPPERYVYDGWNLVMVMNAGGEPVRRYTWGLDLSGTLHGAGGIGGLLAVKTATAAYWSFYDGNGNVTEVLQPSVAFASLASLEACDWFAQMLCDPTSEESVEPTDETGAEGAGTLSDDGLMGAAAAGGGGGGGGTSPCTVLAHYEYDPYGNVVYSSGTYAATNPIRFSTKWYDAETGLYYYGYRYYSPRLGRWVSRDPIGEKGGINLHGFVKNDPVGSTDYLGRSTQCQVQCGLCMKGCMQRNPNNRPYCEKAWGNCNRMCFLVGRPTKRCGGGKWVAGAGAGCSTVCKVGAAGSGAVGAGLACAKKYRAASCFGAAAGVLTLTEILNVWDDAEGVAANAGTTGDYNDCITAFDVTCGSGDMVNHAIQEGDNPCAGMKSGLWPWDDPNMRNWIY